MAPTIGPVRARVWLLAHAIELRDAILLEHDDAGVMSIAAEDRRFLTCAGDIQRERAVLRSPPPA